MAFLGIAFFFAIGDAGFLPPLAAFFVMIDLEAFLLFIIKINFGKINKIK
jgi:hypothetical protein